jgi:hypothetical protein
MPVEQELVMDSHSIRNLRPRPGEPAILPLGNWPPGANTVEDYALITHLQSPDGWGDMLTFAALTTLGTQAAVQYLTERDYAKDVVARLRLPSGELARYYQIVIKAKLKPAFPVQVSYVFHHALNVPTKLSKP